jgi:hypothetical protein
MGSSQRVAAPPANPAAVSPPSGNANQSIIDAFVRLMGNEFASDQSKPTGPSTSG